MEHLCFLQVRQTHLNSWAKKQVFYPCRRSSGHFDEFSGVDDAEFAYIGAFSQLKIAMFYRMCSWGRGYLQIGYFNFFCDVFDIICWWSCSLQKVSVPLFDHKMRKLFSMRIIIFVTDFGSIFWVLNACNPCYSAETGSLQVFESFGKLWKLIMQFSLIWQFLEERGFSKWL